MDRIWSRNCANRAEAELDMANYIAGFDNRQHFYSVLGYLPQRLCMHKLVVTERGLVLDIHANVFNFSVFIEDDMKRFAEFMILLGVAGTSLADEPAFCKSMCSSEKTQCLASAKTRQDKEGLLPTDMPEKNPFARTAQVQMRSSDNGSLEKSGYQHRRQEGVASCDSAFQRCTRGCSVQEGDAVGAVVSRHAKQGS